MNKPDDFDVWRLPDDGLVEKVTIDQDKKVTDAVMMTLEREDHTLGNMVRMQLLDDPNVLFCGYRQKHPLEPAIQLKVQTRSPNPGPVQVVDSALIALNAELKTFKDRFETELRRTRTEVRSTKLGKSRRVRLVDLPGHPRLRAKLDRYAPGAEAIVFVVDAVDFTTQRRAVAEHLFEVLSHPAVQRRRCPTLIACNKSEKITAHPADFVRKRLEKEIEALRATQGTLADTSGESGAGVIGKDGVEFAFDHLTRNAVSAAACAVAGDDLESVREFIVRRG